MICIAKALFNGYFKTRASDKNPLQTIIDLVITPFSPNNNKQAIPKSEAQNIINTALYQPLKINFDGSKINGHFNSIPIGTITEVAETDIEIVGSAIVWLEEFPETIEYLKQCSANDNIPGTSWEILYNESITDNDGIEWLHGCVYCANTIVSNPAYGEKTLLRAIAEDLSKNKEVKTDLDKDSKAEDTAIGLNPEREEIAGLLSQLWSMYEMLDSLYYKTFEIEEAEAVKTQNVDSFSERLNALITNLTERADNANVSLSEAQAELTTLRQEKTEAEKKAAEEKTLTERKDKLTEIGIVIEDTRKDFILSMSEDTFNQYINDLRSVKSARAETDNVKLPEPIGIVGSANWKEAHNKLIKEKK